MKKGRRRRRKKKKEEEEERFDLFIVFALTYTLREMGKMVYYHSLKLRLHEQIRNILHLLNFLALYTKKMT